MIETSRKENKKELWARRDQTEEFYNHQQDMATDQAALDKSQEISHLQLLWKPTAHSDILTFFFVLQIITKREIIILDVLLS